MNGGGIEGREKSGGRYGEKGGRIDTMKGRGGRRWREWEKNNYIEG